jgi:dihydroorotase-like cyclic amidohydrolase
MASSTNNQVDWIVSDHACCSAEQKRSAKDPNNIWLAKSGFGGTEYLLSGVFSEGSKRGMSYNHMAKLLSWNPSRRFGLLEKGDIAIGYDADLVLVDPNESFVVVLLSRSHNKVTHPLKDGVNWTRARVLFTWKSYLQQRKSFGFTHWTLFKKILEQLT